MRVFGEGVRWGVRWGCYVGVLGGGVRRVC